MNNQIVAIDAVKEVLLASKTQIVNSLPKHLKEQSNAFINSALAAVQRDEKLQQAVMEMPHTFINALNECALFGLKPGTVEYYLTPRVVKGKMTVLGITGYQGEIELIYRAGAVETITAAVVRENDTYSFERGKDDMPTHHINGGNFASVQSRGKLIGVYAYGKMRGGAISHVIEHGQDHINAVKAKSQGATSTYSPWVNWEEQMWLKTAIHSLSKWVPTSSEYARQEFELNRETEQAAPAEPAQQAGPPPQNWNNVAPQGAQQPNQQQGPPQGQQEQQRPTWTPPGPGGFEDLGEQAPAGVNTATGEYDPTMEPGWGNTP